MEKRWLKLNNDQFQILVQAILDTAVSTSNINKELEKLKLNPIKVSTILDTSDIKSEIEKATKVHKPKATIEADIEFDKNKLSKSIDLALEKIKNNPAFSEISDKLKSIQSEIKDADGIKLTDLNKQFSSLNQSIRLMNESAKQAKSEIQTGLQRIRFTNTVEEWAKTNTRAMKEFAPEIQNILTLAKTADSVQLKGLQTEFAEVIQKTREANLEGKSFWDSLKSNVGKFTSWFGIGAMVAGAVREVRQMINSVTELDSSLVELSKVQDFTGDGLQKFTDRAFAAADGIGRTGKEVIDATATFKRAGYELESSLNMAQAALIMTNVGDGIRDVTEASSSLIAVLRGFNISDSNVMSVVDMINEVSNNAPVDFANITEGLQRVSGTLAQTGSSIEETIGLLTGGFAQLRNMEKVSTALITISQRLRGVGEDGEVIDGLAAKLQEDFKNLAGIDIELNGELRSTFDILKDYAAVYDTLGGKEQQRLSELAAGIRQVPVINAIVQQWDDVEKAIESASNSLGSAETENEKFLNSIEGKINKYNTALQKLSATAIDSDFLKGAVDTGTSFLNLLTTIIDKVGILTPLLAALTAGLTLKSNTGEINSKLPLHVKVA